MTVAQDRQTSTNYLWQLAAKSGGSIHVQQELKGLLLWSFAWDSMFQCFV